jgi:hypothetical protein
MKQRARVYPIVIWCADRLATHVFQLVETCDSYRRLMSRIPVDPTTDKKTHIAHISEMQDELTSSISHEMEDGDKLFLLTVSATLLLAPTLSSVLKLLTGSSSLGASLCALLSRVDALLQHSYRLVSTLSSSLLAPDNTHPADLVPRDLRFPCASRHVARTFAPIPSPPFRITPHRSSRHALHSATGTH